MRLLRGKGSTRVTPLDWNDIVLPEPVIEEFVGLGKELRNAETLALTAAEFMRMALERRLV